MKTPSKCPKCSKQFPALARGAYADGAMCVACTWGTCPKGCTCDACEEDKQVARVQRAF